MGEFGSVRGKFKDFRLFIVCSVFWPFDTQELIQKNPELEPTMFILKSLANESPFNSQYLTLITNSNFFMSRYSLNIPVNRLLLSYGMSVTAYTSRDIPRCPSLGPLGSLFNVVSNHHHHHHHQGMTTARNLSLSLSLSLSETPPKHTPFIPIGYISL